MKMYMCDGLLFSSLSLSLSLTLSLLQLRIAQEEEEEDMYAVPPDADQIVGGTLPRVSTMPAGDSSYATYGGRSSNSKRRMTIRYVCEGV